MKSIPIFLLSAILFAGSALSQSKTVATTKPIVRKAMMYDFTMNTIEGKPRTLSSYKGKVLLVVNTASECGYTPQYETLEKLYQTYKEKGFTILAFPANNFGAQEPGTNAEIKTFCSTKYTVTFDLFEKISVKGTDIHPLYKFITNDSQFPGEVKWNFQKYLVDRSGKIVARYMSKIDPMSDEIQSNLKKLLATKG